MDNFGGGNWTMIPNIQTHSNPTTPSSQDHMFLQQQQFNQQQQFQPQFNQQQQARFQQPTPPPPPPQQQQQHQSLVSHFHLLHLVEKLSDVVENGTRDQQTDALVGELNTQFEKCQQLLNSIADTINAKSMTVEEQRRKLGETENLAAQRRDLISKYRSSVQELMKDQI